MIAILYAYEKSPDSVKLVYYVSMKSVSGLFASICFLTLIPVALAVELLFGGGAEASVHYSLAAGSGLLAIAAFGFETPRYLAFAGASVAVSLSIIFLLQAIALINSNATLTNIAFDLLGQRPERLLIDALLIWFTFIIIIASEGRSRILGTVTIVSAIAVEIYAYWLNYHGSSIDAEFAGLKVIMLAPFIWLLFESLESRRSGRHANDIL